MAEWSEDHVRDHRFLNSSSSLDCSSWLNWRLGGAIRWNGETAGWKCQQVVCGKPAPPRLYPPPVSIKDRLVGPCEQVLNVPIACR
jgi:hypothetical protein